MKEGGGRAVTLGYSTESLLPLARGGGALQMGLRRLTREQWLQADPDIALRQRAFAKHPSSVMILPEAEAASRETASLMGVEGGIGDAAQSVWEDLCLLTRRQNDDPYRLTAAAVAFPTDWCLDEKIGRPLIDIHAPIHGYAKQLSAGVDHFIDHLQCDMIFGRTNWFVVANDDLRYMPQISPAALFAGVAAENAGERLFVRCERQTLRRLPESGAVLFTIGIYVSPLGQLSNAAVQHVARALANLGSGEHKRRAAPAYAKALAAYAEQRQKDHSGEAF